MARRRDYAAEYARRQARAREQGFAGYYDKRVRGGDVSAPRPKGKLLARRRGHLASSDLLQRVRARQVEMIATIDGEKDAQGRWAWINARVIDIDGDESTYKIRRSVTPAWLRQLRQAIDDSSTTYLSTPSLDIFVVLHASDEDDDEEVA